MANIQIIQFGIYFVACIGYGVALIYIGHALWAYIDHYRAFQGNPHLNEEKEAEKFRVGFWSALFIVFVTTFMVVVLNANT